MKQYYYGRQSIDERDLQAVCEVLRSDFLSQGPRLGEFEKKVAGYCGSAHCIATSNGTTALHLAGLALGLESGDAAWTSALSFVASANALGHCGAQAGFVDIDPATFNLSIDDLAARLEEAAGRGTLPKVLVPVHFAGLSCDMKAIADLAGRYGVRILEDACHALGGRYEGRPIGDCRYSDITVFSLHPVKSITSGEGGLILTRDAAMAERMRRLRSHGMVRGEDVTDKTIGPWHVEVLETGYNHKISELHCALGMSQFARLDEFVARRRALARRYRDRLAPVPAIRFQAVPDPDESAWHILVAQFDFAAIGKSKREIYAALDEHGIHLAVHYYPIPLQPAYRRQGFSSGMYPNAEAYHDAAFTLPLHPGLTEEDVDHICGCIREVVE